MYDIQRESGEEYLDHYIYKSRNECNQITTKRKHGYQEGKTTGKDGIKSLLWAKKCLLDFIDYAKWKFPGDSIEVYPDDERRRKVYEYALLPLGFKIMKDKYKTLIYKL